MSNLSKQIEALLFYKNEIMTISQIANILKTDQAKVKQALAELATARNGAQSGIVLVQNGEEVLLGTNSEFSEIIRELEKEEQEAELSQGALETLAVVVYNTPITKQEIDKIRGVNSSFILRTLRERGLVDHRKDDGKSVYFGTIDLLTNLGIESFDKLRDYATFRERTVSMQADLS